MGNMTKKIFITGCAKTGTTLLLRMCYAFKDTEVLYKEGFNGHELTIDEFVEKESDQKFLIGKRLPPALLSNTPVSDDQFAEQAEWVRANNIGIINVIRDGRDVVLSDGNYVSPQRWISSMSQRKRFSEIIDVEISYEDLVRNPDEVQKKIMKAFNIKKDHKFSDYPKYVEDWVYDWNVSVQGRMGNADASADYGKRKLSDDSIGKDLESYKKICHEDEIEQFEQELKEAGYIE